MKAFIYYELHIIIWEAKEIEIMNLLEKSEDKITCIIKYTILIGNDYDESWGSVDFEIPRLLTDDEMIELGNVDQYDYDNKVKKYTYYDITAIYGNKTKVGIQNIR